MLSNSDIVQLTEFRRELHKHPEISGEETETARRVAGFLASTNPDEIISQLGGDGLAFIYNGASEGPTVMFRAELDALPILELSDIDHKSTVDGKGHLCGHDGHMAMLCGLARLIDRNRPKKGRVVLLFQPAEETGEGAAQMLADPKFASIRPDLSFSLHNLPGLPLGEIAITRGPANCTSCGMDIRLDGRTAHASMPETGISPAQAVAELIPALSELGKGGALEPGFRLVTITHTRIGEESFGIAPGEARILATLRCLLDDDMDDLKFRAEELVRNIAQREKLELAIDYESHFFACTNDIENVELIETACKKQNIPLMQDPGPMRWSEDFGLFGGASQSAMFLLGSGVDHPQLHNPDYDFPDSLIPIGAMIFYQIMQDVLG